MAGTAVQRFYRYHAYVYDATRWTILHGRRQAVERLALRPDSRVMEVGCGTGLNFRHVLERIDPARGGALVGMDFSADMLNVAKKRVAANHWQGVDLLQADASTLDVPQRFDGILFAYSLTMIPDWRGALRRAFAHLKPGGRMVVLDFGRFFNWGPLGPVMRGWLRANHVETLQPYVDVMREICGNVEVRDWLGGYHFTALARRNADA